ncbi:hypothetical protein [Paenibacillus sp. CF384]|uniref:hypothetical protein n=1 Tax=Paenibacillus sp. CF384 TaxID=1884382 RepID=UPI000896D8B8|nr:hypothetical protein [Paenibacillus sp. CF384]SDX14681.1 hypothetical protein SAMN05518855_1009138 [Paenibacillus sp. CF384]
MALHGFDEAHKKWLTHHLSLRSGERKGRLERGHAHGEILFARSIWWELRGSLEHLHPEFEIEDWRGRPWFADFAFLPPGGYQKLLIEVKSFSSHARDMDRFKFSGSCNREIYVQAIGYRLISIPYDDIERKPELIISLLRLYLNQFQPNAQSISRSLLIEKEVMRFALVLGKPVKPIDISKHLTINYRTTLRHIRELVSKGKLRPVISGKGTKVLGYEITPTARIDVNMH